MCSTLKQFKYHMSDNKKRINPLYSYTLTAHIADFHGGIILVTFDLLDCYVVSSDIISHSSVVELKVEMVCIHEKRLRKCLSKLKGIEKVEVDTSCQKVVVTGYTHKNKILKAVRRGGLKADFWSAQNELLNAYVSANYASLRFNNPFNFF
ncbi:hypothetical protein VNO78_11519 [Psophocarpus tetragonolobus]|uniref:HMA domain-containing protein n=1 Tax=Psophocarpus tetragonolobus TaxID=3891 RepID=A0AAN9XN91_PSOTE